MPDPVMEPVPVRISPEDLAVIRAAEEFTPTFGAWQTLIFQGLPSETTPGLNNTPVLPADLRRRKCYIQVNPTTEGTLQTSENSITSPAASAVVTQIVGTAVIPGSYHVEWAVELDGTVSATDQDNFLFIANNSVVSFVSSNDGAVGRYPQPSFNMVIPQNNTFAVLVRAVAAGTVGAIYTAQFTLTPLSPQLGQGYVLIGTLGQVSNGQGGRLYAGQKWEIKAHSQMWMVGDGVTPMAATVYVERDAEL